MARPTRKTSGYAGEMAGTALSVAVNGHRDGRINYLAHSFFQIYLYMAPCEQCVYIRYAMFVMVIGGVIAAINPKISC